MSAMPTAFPSKLLIITLAAVAALVACGSKDRLSRTTALELLAGSEELDTPASETILLGIDFRATFAGRSGAFNWGLVDDLIALRYLKKDGNQIQVTDLGEKEDWGRARHQANARIIPVANRELSEVTGIVQQEGTMEAEVQFSWRWRLTPLGAQLADRGGTIATRYNLDDVNNSVAACRLYDDGWRLEAVRF